MSKQKIIIGALLIVLLATGVVYITLMGEGVKLRVDNDKSTFYILNENNRWEVSGREYNKLFDGTSRMNRRLSGVRVETLIGTNNVTIKRTTPYIRGPVIIDTYYFEGDVADKELFPIYHQVEVFNGSGYFYRYEVRDLEYDGNTEKLNVVSMTFGKNMKITWDGGYRWAWVYKTGILKVQYDIPTDYEVYNVRLFDPEWHGSAWNVTIYEPQNKSYTFYFLTSSEFNWTTNATLEWAAYSVDAGANDTGIYTEWESLNINFSVSGNTDIEDNGTSILVLEDVVGANDKVYSYDYTGTLEGTFTLNSNVNPAGIDRKGNNNYIAYLEVGVGGKVDEYDLKWAFVQTFNLHADNDAPNGIEWNGTHFLIPDGVDDLVYIYDAAFNSLGSWDISGSDCTGSQGILNYSNFLYIVDATDEVCKFTSNGTLLENIDIEPASLDQPHTLRGISTNITHFRLLSSTGKITHYETQRSYNKSLDTLDADVAHFLTLWTKYTSATQRTLERSIIYFTISGIESNVTGDIEYGTHIKFNVTL